ncbi:MAG: DNA polymerase III subunit beta [Candidatus Pristimantibacillus sp.]
MSILLEGSEKIEKVGLSKALSFNVPHAEMMNKLALCAKVVPSSAAIPILHNVKFDLNGDTLFITAMDTDQSVLQMMKVDNVGKVNGSFLFPSKEGIELVKRLPEGNLTFTKEDTTLFITYGKRGKANVKVLNSDEYPNLPKMESDDVTFVPIEVLRKGAIATKFTLLDPQRPALSGIFIYNHEGKLGFLGTDTHRIYRYVSDVQIANPSTFVNSIIPALNFKHIVASLKGGNEISLLITNDYLVLRDKSANIIYFGRLTDATYPDAQITRIYQGMGAKGSKTVSLRRREFDETLNRALSLDATNNRITLETSEEGVFTLHTRSENSELLEEFPDAIVDKGFPVIKFNGKYLRDALLVGDREVEQISLQTKDAGSTGFVTMEGDPSVVVVINPVR